MGGLKQKDDQVDEKYKPSKRVKAAYHRSTRTQSLKAFASGLKYNEDWRRNKKQARGRKAQNL